MWKWDVGLMSLGFRRSAGVGVFEERETPDTPIEAFGQIGAKQLQQLIGLSDWEASPGMGLNSLTQKV